MASRDPPRPVAQPVVAHGKGQVDQRGPRVPPRGRFGQDQIARTRSRGPFVVERVSVWMFWTGPNVSCKGLKMLALCRTWRGHRAVAGSELRAGRPTRRGLSLLPPSSPAVVLPLARAGATVYARPRECAFHPQAKEPCVLLLLKFPNCARVALADGAPPRPSRAGRSRPHFSKSSIPSEMIKSVKECGHFLPCITIVKSSFLYRGPRFAGPGWPPPG